MGVTDDLAGDPTVQLAASPLLVEPAAQAASRKGDPFAACVKALSEERTGISVDNGAKVNAKCGRAALLPQAQGEG